MVAPLHAAPSALSSDAAAASLPATTYLAAALQALVREEQAGRRQRRLLEAGQAWQRFRGRLDSHDVIELVLEDAAVNQPEPFDVRRFLRGPAALRAVLEETLRLAISGPENKERPPVDSPRPVRLSAGGITRCNTCS